jgi:UDP-glucose 4-epimerase
VESLRVLVTGGAGFIGSHLVRALVRAGHVVRVLDNLSTGSLENLGDALSSVELVVGDVKSYGVVEKAVKGADAVAHLAALIDVAESIEKPDLYFDVNAKGTYNVAKACKGVSVLVFASTCAVHGEPAKLPIAEDHPIAPKSPYAATKVAGEAFVQTYANIHGYRPAILRLFNVYGPKQSKAYAGVIVEFIKRVSRGEPPIIFGDGEQTRDFIHVSDVVEAIMMAITNEKTRDVFNIGSGKPVTINQLAKLILKLMGREDLKPIHTTPRPGDIRHSVADITKAREALGFKPRIGLEEGLQSLITTYTHQQKHYNSTHCR